MTNFKKKELSMSYPQSVKDQFLTLRTQGQTYAQIAGILKVSRHTLIIWGKAYKVQIDADRAIDQEDLINGLQLRRTQRLYILAELYHRVCREIEKANLTSRGVGTLVTMLLKLNTAIEAYDIDPAACDLTVQKTEPSDPLTENASLQAPETPELTDMVQKTEPKLNQDTPALRTEHSSSPEPSLPKPGPLSPEDLAAWIQVLENSIQILAQDPPTPEIQDRISKQQHLLAQYRNQLANATS
jgi:hypothetical protein